MVLNRNRYYKIKGTNNSGGTTPVGIKDINANGAYDVTNFAVANVNVPIPEGYIMPSGTFEVNENGTHNVKEYESVTVNVPTTGGSAGGTAVPNSGNVEKVYFNTALSADEIINLIKDLTYIEISGLTDRGNIILATSDYSLAIAIVYHDTSTGNSSTTFSMYVVNPAVGDLIDTIVYYDSTNGLNWEFNEYSINSEVINDLMGMPVGVENELIKNLVSTTPFGSGSAGSGIVEVEEFPTENVQDYTFYKKANKANVEVYMSMFGQTMNVVDAGAVVYKVDELPSSMEITDMETGALHLYVWNSKAYITTDGTTTMTFGELYSALMGETFEDKVVESVGQIDSNGVYVIYGEATEIVGVKNSTYNFINEEWVNPYEDFMNLINGNLKSAILPEVGQIRKYAFAYNTFLGKVSLPLVTRIPQSAFIDCESLYEINIPKVTHIEMNAFSGCESLQTIKLPLVEAIGISAFGGCMSLTDMYLGYEGVVNLLDFLIFSSCHNAKVHVRAEHLSNYQSHNQWSQAVSNGYITLVGDYTEE